MGIVAPNSIPEWNPNDTSLKRFNWGAFGFDWIWGLSHGALKKVIGWQILCLFLLFIPILGWLAILFIKIYFGCKGNEWAYKGRVWYSIEDFQSTQKRWAALTAVCSLIFVLAVFFIIALATLPALMPSLMPTSSYEYNNTHNSSASLEETMDKMNFDLLKLDVNAIMLEEIIKDKEFKTPEEVVDFLIEHKKKYEGKYNKYEYKKLSPKSYSVTRIYKDNDYVPKSRVDGTMDKVYILTKEENCSIEKQNCKIYYYENVVPGDKPEPKMVVCYDNNGETRKLKAESN